MSPWWAAVLVTAVRTVVLAVAAHVRGHALARTRAATEIAVSATALPCSSSSSRSSGSRLRLRAAAHLVAAVGAVELSVAPHGGQHALVAGVNAPARVHPMLTQLLHHS